MGAEGDNRRRYATREALKDKQGASFKKTSIEIPVMLLKHSLVTKTKTGITCIILHSPLSLQEVCAHSHVRLIKFAIKISMKCYWSNANSAL